MLRKTAHVHTGVCRTRPPTPVKRRSSADATKNKDHRKGRALGKRSTQGQKSSRTRKNNTFLQKEVFGEVTHA